MQKVTETQTPLEDTVEKIAHFLCNAIANGRVLAIAVAESMETPEIYFQFAVCGDENERPNGIQAQFVGPAYLTHCTDEQRQGFRRALKNGWYEDEGNAELIEDVDGSLSGIMDIVTRTAHRICEAYSLPKTMSWRVLLDP